MAQYSENRRIDDNHYDKALAVRCSNITSRGMYISPGRR